MQTRTPVAPLIVAATLFISGATTAAAEEAAPPASPPAASAAEVEALRREIQDLRDQIRRLQETVQALQGAGAPPAATAPEAPPPPPAPAPAAPARSQNLMNPAISAVFQSIGNTSLARHDEQNGFDLSEAEVAFQSVVDPYAKVDLFLSFPVGETPEVEEGAVSTLALPASLQLKGGRFKSAFGKWNTYHTHAFFTVDRPDVLVNFFGEESFTNDGLSLSVLIPNPAGLYIDSTSEVGTAREGDAFNSDSRRLTYLEHLAAFFNTSASSTLEVGLSGAWGRTGPTDALEAAIDAAGAAGAVSPRDDLPSSVTGIDLTYKWKPPQYNVYRSFLWQTEILQSHRDVDVLDLSGPQPALRPGAVTSLGGYTYVETQFTKRWKEGLRVDVSGFPDSTTARAWSTSAVVRFLLSEFQEIRFQASYSRRNDEAALRFDGNDDDTRLFFEWIPVIGAHGAHKY